MLVKCSKCKTKLFVPDEKIKPEGSKFKCSKCHAILIIKKPAYKKGEESLLKRKEVQKSSAPSAEIEEKRKASFEATKKYIVDRKEEYQQELEIPRWHERKLIILTVFVAVLFLGTIFIVQQSLKGDLEKANNYWESGQKAKAVEKYKSIINNNLSSVDRKYWSTIFKRSIEFEVEQGNTDSAKMLIENALKNDIKVTLNIKEASDYFENVLQGYIEEEIKKIFDEAMERHKSLDIQFAYCSGLKNIGNNSLYIRFDNPKENEYLLIYDDLLHRTGSFLIQKYGENSFDEIIFASPFSPVDSAVVITDYNSYLRYIKKYGLGNSLKKFLLSEDSKELGERNSEVTQFMSNVQKWQIPMCAKKIF